MRNVRIEANHETTHHDVPRPSDPGFLGSYDWRSTILGFLLITLSCFLATEYIAKEFRFQPALGDPIFRSGAFAVYQPFAWVAWGWRYCTSRDPWIRNRSSAAR